MIVNWKAFAVTATTLLVFVLETAVATDVNHSRGGRVRGLQGQGQGQGQGNGGIPPGLSRKGGTKASKQLKMNAKTGKVTGQELAALKSTGNLKNSFQAELQDLCGESTFLMNGCNVSFDLKDLTPTKSSYVFENTVSCDETIIVELIPSLTYLPQSAFMIESETGNIFELVSLPHIEDVGCMYTVISEQDVDAEALSRYKFGADSKGNSSFGQGGGNGGGKPNNPGNGGKNGNGGRNQNQSNGNEPPKWRGRRFFGSDRYVDCWILAVLLGVGNFSHLISVLVSSTAYIGNLKKATIISVDSCETSLVQTVPLRSRAEMRRRAETSKLCAETCSR